MTGYLLVYNKRTHDLAITPHADRTEAIRAYDARELAKAEYEEVVLLFAESEEAMRSTHSRFFETPHEIVGRPREVTKAQAAS
jgi:hypothetical protein